MLSCSYFKPYLSDDLIGVQVGGAIKNVITLAIGFVNNSQNTKAFILTRGLVEMARLAKQGTLGEVTASERTRPY